MAPALISTPVLPAKPQADTRSYISGLLDELRERIDGLPVVPGKVVPVDASAIMELRGTFMQASIAIRNELKWRGL
jgi:hypothetical protein